MDLKSALDSLVCSEIYLGSRKVQAAFVDNRLILAPVKGNLDSWVVSDFTYPVKVSSKSYLEGVYTLFVKRWKFDRCPCIQNA